MRLRQLGHPQAALAKGLQDVAPRRIRQRREHPVEDGLLILNHKVKY